MRVSSIFRRVAEVVEYVEKRVEIIGFSLAIERDVEIADWSETVLTLYLDAEPDEICSLWNEIYANFEIEGFVISLLPRVEVKGGGNAFSRC
jgi:hypothetical protein